MSTLASITTLGIISGGLIAIVLGDIACKETPPEPYIRTIELQAIDASCTEAWLRVKFTETVEQRTFLLKRDGQTILAGQTSLLDTVVLDTELSPNRTYTYTAYHLNLNLPIDSSARVSVATLDSTSHDFIWQIDTLGDGNSSMLNDVALINDTLAYAVGEIYKKDSLGNWDPNAYNLVKWNGQRWELMRIQFYTFCGQADTGSYPAKSIFAFSATDIWIGLDGSQVVRWNGQSQSVPMCTPISINELWGETPNSVYAVGNGGGIAHYSSGTWERLESGTGADIINVWGQGVRILCVTIDRSLLRISSTSVVETLNWTGANIRGIWFNEAISVYVSGPGVWHYDGARWRELSGLPFQFYTGVRGTGANDLVAIGWNGKVGHYNGIEWHMYSELSNPIWEFEALAVRGRTVAVVGFEGISIGGGAIAAIGKRE